MKIILPGEPIAKIRPRICRNYSYDPQEKVKNAAKWQILDQMKSLGINFPIPKDFCVSVDINFYTNPPSGEENLLAWGFKDNTFKKDIDNLCKFYLDVMNKIVYEDDRQIGSLQATKSYTNDPRTEINIMKKQTISDKTKQVLCNVTPAYFLSLAKDMQILSEKMIDNTECVFEEKDFLESAYLLCKFAEDHAETLTKIKKKFPGFAKVLNEEKNKLEGL